MEKPTNPPVNAIAVTSGKHLSNASAQAATIAQLRLLIPKLRSACNQPAIDPNGDEFRFALAAWAEILADIPPEHLNTAYVEAMRAHASSFPLTAGEVYAAWDKSAVAGQLRAQRAMTKYQQQEAKRCERQKALSSAT